MPTNDIKKIYNDALYWASSNQSKGKDYHLTRTQEAILRKLIHYSTKDSKITYSNDLISEHTFIDSEVIRKEIPKIVKKGFLSSASITVSDNGEIYKRRTLFVKWDFIQQVLNDIQSVKESKSLESTQHKLELTQEKIDWLLPLMQNYDKSNTIDNILALSQEQLILAFYGENGYWIVDENTIENKYQWRIRNTSGSKCEVYNAYNTTQNMKINVHDLEAYLDEKSMTFIDFDLSIYEEIMQNGLPKREEMI